MFQSWSWLTVQSVIVAAVFDGLLQLGFASEGFAKNMPTIAVSCKPNQNVTPGGAQIVCSEILAYLTTAFPDQNFRPEEEIDQALSERGMIVSIDNMSKTSLALSVVWLAANGAATPGMPLRFAVFDREVDAEMRRGFYNQFFEKNPLPF